MPDSVDLATKLRTLEFVDRRSFVENAAQANHGEETVAIEFLG